MMKQLEQKLVFAYVKILTNFFILDLEIVFHLLKLIFSEFQSAR